MSNPLTGQLAKQNSKALTADSNNGNLDPASWRLPCRGCMKSCKNYTTCGGRPWQLAADVSAKY